MNKLAKRFTLALLLLALTLPAFSFQKPLRDGPEKRMGKNLEALELTSEQEALMKDLRFAHEKVLIKLQADLQTAQLELKKLKHTDEPNKKKIYAQIDKVSDERADIAKAKVDHHLEVRKILSAEQYEIFQQKLKHRSGGKGPHCKHGRGNRMHRK